LNRIEHEILQGEYCLLAADEFFSLKRAPHNILLVYQGYQIPRGWAVTYSIKGTHDRSSVFSTDTESFNPDRWMSLDSPDSSSDFNFIPFGAGARACVGRHYVMLFVRIFCIELARTCRRWRLKATSPVQMLKVPVIRPKHRLFAVFERRVSAGY
jgi:cytochrome P450